MSNEIYKTLSSINVESDVKGKNGFKYLSWASALHHLLQRYPDSSWEHREWGDLPYLQTKAGCFVEVSVTINGLTRKQLHPILDFRNQPIQEPNAFQVNTSLQRALAKAIGLHGLGLYIYQGEDLPPSEKEALEQARCDLADLLKTAGKFDTNAKNYLMKLTYDEIQTKISEYRNREVKND